MAEIFGDADNIAGGTSGALQTDFADSVDKVFSDEPEGRDGVRGRLRRRERSRDDRLEPRDGLQRTSPSRRSRARRARGRRRRRHRRRCSRTSRRRSALIEYLATPEAADDLGGARRLLVAEQERRHGRRTPTRSRGRRPARWPSAEIVPLRHVRPPAGGVRRHAGPGHVEALHRTSSRTRTTSTGSRSSWRRRPRRPTGEVDVERPMSERRRRRKPPQREASARRTGEPGRLAARTAVVAAVPRPRRSSSSASGSSTRRSARSSGASSTATRRRVHRVRQLRDALHRRHARGPRSGTTSLWVARRPGVRDRDRARLRRSHRADPLVGRVQDRRSSCRWRSRCSPPA